MEGRGRSEGLVLQETIKFAKETIQERGRLIAQLEAAGQTVDPQLKQ